MKMAGRANLLQGTHDLLILTALSTGELHGLGVSRRIEQMTAGKFAPQPGSPFPPCIVWRKPVGSDPHGRRPNTDRRAKYYTLTKAGKKQLGEEAAHWNQIALAMRVRLRRKGVA